MDFGAYTIKLEPPYKDQPYFRFNNEKYNQWKKIGFTIFEMNINMDETF